MKKYKLQSVPTNNQITNYSLTTIPSTFIPESPIQLTPARELSGLSDCKPNDQTPVSQLLKLHKFINRRETSKETFWMIFLYLIHSSSNIIEYTTSFALTKKVWE